MNSESHTKTQKSKVVKLHFAVCQPSINNKEEVVKQARRAHWNHGLYVTDECSGSVKSHFKVRYFLRCMCVLECIS